MIKRKISAVLFDLDGTLVDSAPDFHRTLGEVLSQSGLPLIEFTKLRAQASDGARAMLRLALPEQDPRFNGLLEQFLKRYLAEPTLSGGVFDGVEQLINQLDHKGIPWGVVTNKPRPMSEQVLCTLSLNERCSTLICPEDVKQTKPDPEGLLLAAHQLDVAPSDCLYLGDHKRDIDAGRAAGMITVACGFGYLRSGESANSWDADFTIEHATALIDTLGPVIFQSGSDNPTQCLS